MRRGEVRWYRFSRPDKRRPVLILTRDSVLDYLGEVTVAPITTTVRGVPSEVPLGPADGMPRECAANLDHLQTVAKNRIGALLTALPSPRMEEVRSALLFALGFAAGGHPV
ncbi:MAG: type II toxin-antitoxin system PemK/MazF family toxin [Thermoanaerobaculia bacterium]